MKINFKDLDDEQLAVFVNFVGEHLTYEQIQACDAEISKNTFPRTVGALNKVIDGRIEKYMVDLAEYKLKVK